MRRLTPIILSLCLLFTGCHPVHAMPSNQEIGEAWAEAQELGQVEKNWRLPCVILWEDSVVVAPGRGRLLGLHQWRLTVDRKGRVVFQERITLFFTEWEMINKSDLVHTVLVHELLHSIHLRRCLTDQEWCQYNPDSERWVREVMGDVSYND